MISKTVDLADQLNAATHYAIAECTEWETVTIQAVGLSGTCNITGTNNDGSITGSTNGGPRDATDFNAVQAVNLTSGTAVTAVTGTTLFRISPIGFRFLRLGDGAAATTTKLLLTFSKPY